MNKEEYKNKNKRYHAHLVEDEEEEEEGPQRKLTKEKYAKEYVLFSALSGSVIPREDTWLIDSGVSMHMEDQKKTLSKHELKKYPHKLSLGDDYQYHIKGIGESSYNLDSKTPIRMNKVLYVLGLKKNLLSISALDNKGNMVVFIDGQVLMWPKGKSIKHVVFISEEE